MAVKSLARRDARRTRTTRATRITRQEPLAGDARGDCTSRVRCGVLTDLEVASAGDGRNPSTARERWIDESGPTCGTTRRRDHRPGDPQGARAPGVVIEPAANARGASRLSSNRAIATMSVFYRARSFSRFRPDARPDLLYGARRRRILDRSPTPRLGRETRTRQPLADITPSFVDMVRPRAFPARRGRAKTPADRASNNVTFSRSALKTHSRACHAPRQNRRSRPFHQRPRRLIAIPSRLEQERLRPGRSVLRAGAQVRERTPPNTRARVPNVSASGVSEKRAPFPAFVTRVGVRNAASPRSLTRAPSPNTQGQIESVTESKRPRSTESVAAAGTSFPANPRARERRRSTTRSSRIDATTK